MAMNPAGYKRAGMLSLSSKSKNAATTGNPPMSKAGSGGVGETKYGTAAGERGGGQAVTLMGKMNTPHGRDLCAPHPDRFMGKGKC